jgi:hypothetical protein
MTIALKMEAAMRAAVAAAETENETDSFHEFACEIGTCVCNTSALSA